MDTQTVPDGRRTDEWLAYMADHCNLTDAIEDVIAAGMHYQMLGYLLGLWESTHRADELAERIARSFARSGR